NDEAADNHDQRQAHQESDGRTSPHEAQNATLCGRRRPKAIQRVRPRVDGIGHHPLSRWQHYPCRPTPASSQSLQARRVPSSSFSAHLMTSSSFSLPCVNFETITVFIAWLYIWAPTSERAGAPNIEVSSSARGG